ncbi:MAG: type II secretion system protein [Ruminococcaceae bacterium]|nr:type II secretion system protein [Oscillospiraceae bacterium]
MNKKNNRKGFTTVELVIVIAVIAILATVLIPTFSNLIGKAEESVALQTANNAMKAVSIEAADPLSDIEITGDFQLLTYQEKTGSEKYFYAIVNNNLVVLKDEAEFEIGKGTDAVEVTVAIEDDEITFTADGDALTIAAAITNIPDVPSTVTVQPVSLPTE